MIRNLAAQLGPECYAVAIQKWCDNPSTGGNLPSRGDTVLLDRNTECPIGDLMFHIFRGEVHLDFVTPNLQHAFDYYGIRLSLDEDEAVPYVHADINAKLRQTGWENEFIRELDARFTENPNLGRELFAANGNPGSPFEETLSRLSSTGLTAANWQRLPHLGTALGRHQIPLKLITSDVNGNFDYIAIGVD